MDHSEHIGEMVFADELLWDNPKVSYAMGFVPKFRKMALYIKL